MTREKYALDVQSAVQRLATGLPKDTSNALVRMATVYVSLAEAEGAVRGTISDELLRCAYDVQHSGCLPGDVYIGDMIAESSVAELDFEAAWPLLRVTLEVAFSDLGERV